MTAPKRPRLPSARLVAETALARVLDDGAFAAAALEAEIDRLPQLEARDRALATELLYGTLRVFPWLEAELDAHAKKSVTKLRPRVRAALALGAYQILLLDRVPPYAAVSEAVDGVRAASDPRVAGFANAVLRKLAATVEKNGRADRAVALKKSIPRWLLASMASALGEAEVDRVIDLGAEAPPIGLAAPHAADRDPWIARLRAAMPAASFEPGSLSPHAILVKGAGRPQALEGVATGALWIQEEGSQLVALAVGAAPGERILDACAGRGHKTAMLAHAVAPSGRVDAADLHEHKLERLRAELSAQGLAPPETFAVDWSVGSGDVPRDYDAVLVDAPCSGSGTIRRRPDILLRRKKDDVLELARLQRAILTRAAGHVRPGGRLVYAVCSFLREEAEDVLAAVDLPALALEPAPFAGAPARARFGEAFSGRLTPDRDGTDGYFLASLVKKP